MDRKQVKDRRKVLLDVYRETCDGKPSDTIALLTEKIGAVEAQLAVSELVRSVGDWDGRVYPYVRRWADGVSGAASREDMEAAWIYQPPEIHPAHINQLGQTAMRK